jgi:hypothetical protein
MSSAVIQKKYAATATLQDVVITVIMVNVLHAHQPVMNMTARKSINSALMVVQYFARKNTSTIPARPASHSALVRQDIRAASGATV